MQMQIHCAHYVYFAFLDSNLLEEILFITGMMSCGYYVLGLSDHIIVCFCFAEATLQGSASIVFKYRAE